MNKNRLVYYMSIFIFCGLLLSGCAEKVDSAVNTTQEEYSGAVSYLGPEGTYTQEAVKQFFGSEGDYRPQKNVKDAVQKMLDGESIYAVIPQENTIGGPVYDYVDELLAHDNIHIIGEVELPIRQALLVAEGTRAEDILTVYSHKQGLIQGKEWLSNNLPKAEVVEVSSTAEGAKKVAESGTKDVAAIASTGAAEVYGLNILAENIQQNDENKTRFYVLADGAANIPDKGTRVVFSATGEAENLPELLKRLDKADMTIISIHDRPEKTQLGHYIYLFECIYRGYDSYQKVSELDSFLFRYYGAFDLR